MLNNFLMKTRNIYSLNMQIYKHIKVLLGWRNWAVFTYNSFIENIFVIFYVVLALNDFSNTLLRNILIFYCFSILSTSYGYLVNDYGDIDLDTIHGKKNTFLGMRKIYALLYVLSAFLLSVILAIPFLKQDFFLVFWMIWIFFTTSYSTKPLRLKEKGKYGLIIVVLAQRLLPILLVFAAFNYLYLIDVCIISLYVLFRGLSSDLNHQLEDYQLDVRTSTTTFVVNRGFDASQKIFTTILRIERVLLLIFLLRMGLLLGEEYSISTLIIWMFFTLYVFMLLKAEIITIKGYFHNPFSKNEKNIMQFIHHPFPTIVLPFLLLLFLVRYNFFYVIFFIILIINKNLFNSKILKNNFLYLSFARFSKKSDRTGGSINH